MKTHPARHALVEICNLHSEALEFKPIHRLLTNIDVKDMLLVFRMLKSQNKDLRALRVMR